jgi:hypothetical protein
MTVLFGALLRRRIKIFAHLFVVGQGVVEMA